MIAYEFSTQLTEDGKVSLPEEYVDALPVGSAVRVIVLVEEPTHTKVNGYATTTFNPIDDNHVSHTSPNKLSKIKKKTVRVIDKNNKAAEDIPREEALRRLRAAGYLREPSSWDGPEARAWRELPEDEKQVYLKQMHTLYLPGSPASNYINESRQRTQNP